MLFRLVSPPRLATSALIFAHREPVSTDKWNINIQYRITARILTRTTELTAL